MSGDENSHASIEDRVAAPESFPSSSQKGGFPVHL